jgi:hypothetical protein
MEAGIRQPTGVKGDRGPDTRVIWKVEITVLNERRLGKEKTPTGVKLMKTIG